MLVQKYGGMTLSTPEKILKLAARIAELHQKGESMIVVVSAMGKTTDQLIELAYQICDRPNRRELDMLLTTGERVSMALMSMALAHLGRPSISFTGSQAGVFTSSSHSNAHIIDISPHRVEEELQKNKIVVLAGFQGVNPQKKEITTLGRGGSDTTAVAMAAYFKAKRCEILKDVPGVYSADPSVVSNAKLYQELPYQVLTEMCWWGAKVLHSRSADLAWKKKVPLFIGLANDPSRGTLIHQEDEAMFEQQEFWGVNALSPVEHLQIKALSSQEGYALLHDFCEMEELPLPKVLASTYENGSLRMMIYGDQEMLQTLLKAAEKNTMFLNLEISCAAVSMTGSAMGQPGLIEKVLSLLQKTGVTVYKVLNSPRTVSFIVDRDKKDTALKSLHTLV